jgi:hypothetical protein
VTACTLGTVPPPASFPPDRVWAEDQIPDGSSPFESWNWDQTQKASGVQSHTDFPSAGLHYHGFSDAWSQVFYVAATDELFTYVLIDPCDPPQEILIEWNDGEAHFAFWGADLIDWGTLGVNRINMGPLPAAGEWVRLEVPASTLNLGSRTVGLMTFAAFGGQVWFDRSGAAPTCTPSIAPPPNPPSGETIWLDDDAPAGADLYGIWSWDTAQKASGTQSHTEPAATGNHTHGFGNAWSEAFYVPATDKLICYVLIDPCDPPREIMIQWDSPESVRAFWGEDLIDSGTLDVDRFGMGPLPAAGSWVRLEVPASMLGLGGKTVGNMFFSVYDGHAWFDRVGTAATCTLDSVDPPSSDPAETVWMEDEVPGGDQFGTWEWDPEQVASGTLSHTHPPATGVQHHGFVNAWSQGLYVGSTDSVFTYVLIDPCDPPQEILIEWHDGQAHRAFWGADQIPWGDLGVDRIAMGPLPATGEWVRLDVPASTLNLGASTLAGLVFATYGGRAWFDRAGVVETCTTSIAPPPASFPPDTVWVDDALPPGVSSDGTWIWDTSQKASGTASSTQPEASGIQQRTFDFDPTGLYVGAHDNLVAYVLIDPCDPPQEIMIQWTNGSWEHRAYWGADLIPYGEGGTPSRVSMGPLPSTGQWVRLEVPSTAVGVADSTVVGLSFVVYDGRAWFDRAGKVDSSGAPGLASLSLSPTSVVGGASSTGTVTLTGAAPAANVTVSLSSSNESVATVPATATIVSGANSATFAVTTSVVASDATATITATLGSETRNAVLGVTAAPINVSSVSVTPSLVVGGVTATATVVLAEPAPPGGATVNLSSSDPTIVSVPGSVTVPQNTISAEFTVITYAVPTGMSATITASASGTSASGTLSVMPPAPPALSDMIVSPSSMPVGGVTTGNVYLTIEAPSGGIAISLSSSDPAVATVPATVTVPAGAIAAGFTIAAQSVSSPAGAVCPRSLVQSI